MGMVCLKASNPVGESTSRSLLFTVNRIDQGIRVVQGFHYRLTWASVHASQLLRTIHIQMSSPKSMVLFSSSISDRNVGSERHALATLRSPL